MERSECGYEELKGVKVDLQAFVLNNWKDRVAIYRQEKAEIGFGGWLIGSLVWGVFL